MFSTFSYMYTDRVSAKRCITINPNSRLGVTRQNTLFYFKGLLEKSSKNTLLTKYIHILVCTSHHQLHIQTLDKPNM